MPLLPQLSLVARNGERIALTDRRDVERGDSFLLYCNVTLDVGHVAKITWRKRGLGAITPEFSDKTGRDAAGSRYVYSMINVTDPQPGEDGGEYVCTVRNHMGQENNASVDIRMTEQGPCRIRHVQHSAPASRCMPMQVRKRRKDRQRC